MGTQLFLFCLGTFLLPLFLTAPVSENFVVSVSTNVTVHTKSAATLPCWLSPQQSAVGMEVNWFHRDQFDAPVMLYKDKSLNSASQPASYAGRVSFGQKDTSSGGLKDGDVTLRLANVTLADAGEYTCYVSSDKHHDRASLNLIVTQTGVAPLLSAVVKENNKVNLSCESGGWYPEPKLRWWDSSGVLSPKALVHSKDSSGLLSVHSWLLVSSSSEVSCSVGLSGGEAREGRMRVETPKSQAQEGSSVAGWILFAVVAAAVLALLGFLYFKKHKDSRSRAANAELEHLLSKDLLSILDGANYVNVQLETTDNEFITIMENKLRDKKIERSDSKISDFPDGDKVTCFTAVRGTPGFSSGKHYWEVSLDISPNVPPKQSWWLGVTNLSVFKDSSLSPTVNNGFWFLSSSRDNAGVLQFSSSPPIYLGLSDLPKKVGVFLDYDNQKLGFYNVDDKNKNRHLIGFFPTKFSGTVFPLFNPGLGDKAPMEIIHRNQDNKPPMEHDIVE